MKRFFLALVFLALPALAQAQDLPVRIGHAAALSGPLAEQGQESENGVRLALEEFQARGLTLGGRRPVFELIGEDDQATPAGAAMAARRLIDSGVRGVVGHLNSSASLSAARLYAQAGVPMISPASTSPVLTHQGLAQVFRTVASDARQAQVLGKFLQTQTRRRIAIIDDRTAYAQGLANGIEQAFKTGGGRNILREITSSQTADFTALVARLRHFGPEWVVYAGLERQGALLLRQMRQAGLNASFLTGDGGCNEAFLGIAREAMSEKVFCARPGLPLERLADSGFVERYRERFGTEPRTPAPQAYAAASALIEAMLAANSADASHYLPMLRKRHFRSVEGEFSFEANGDLRSGPVNLYRFKAGAWQALP